MNKHLATSRQTGLTLIELMVSMVISLFLVLGAVTVYSQGRQNFQATEGISRLQENMRFALSVMEPDIRLAGFWGMHNNSFNIDTTGIAITCDGNPVTDFILDVNTTIEAMDDVSAGNTEAFTDDCSTFGAGLVGDTDVLFTRHASGSARVLDADQVQLQSNMYQSRLMDDGNLPLGYTPAPDSQTFDYVFNAWYIAQDSTNLDGIPSLRRLTLDGNEVIDEEVIAGVENMQIQFGIDTLDGTGSPDNQIDRYVDSDDPILASATVMAVRVWILLRTEYAERGFVDGATYTPLDGDLDDIEPDDNLRRVQLTKTIFLRNYHRDIGPSA